MTDSATKSVAMTMPEPDPKLKAGKFKDLLRYLGPGIIGIRIDRQRRNFLCQP